MKIMAVVAVVVLAGCASGSTEPTSGSAEPSTSPVVDTTAPVAAGITAQLRLGEKWILVGGTTAPSPVGFDVTLRFDEGAVSGKAPVNRYSGQALLGDGTAQISGLVSTKMAGPQPAMDAEQAYLGALGKVTAWEVGGDQTLVLSDANGPLLTYAVPGSAAAFAVSLIGLPLKKANAAIADQGLEVRVVSVDGQMKPVTMDYRPDRVNLTVVDGAVTDASVG